MATNNTTAEIVDSAQQSVLNVNMSNVTKLSATNYLMWSLQVYALLDGYELAGYLDGTTAPPATTVTVNGTTSFNPAFAKWKRQDWLIYSGLLGVISLSIQPTLTRSLTAADIWRTLASTYAKPSRGHIKQLKLQLKQWSKGTKTIDEYFQGFSTRFDQLALLGKPVDHEDQIEYVLGGLPEEYMSTVDQLEGRDTPPSLTEVHEKVLNREATLLTVSQHSTVAPVSANTAITRPRNNPNRQSHNSAQPWHQNSANNNNGPRQDSRVGKGYQGKCQICGVQGHSAKRCFQLYNTHNKPPTPSYPPWQPRANFALTSPHPDAAWLMEAARHII